MNKPAGWKVSYSPYNNKLWIYKYANFTFQQLRDELPEIVYPPNLIMLYLIEITKLNRMIHKL